MVSLVERSVFIEEKSESLDSLRQYLEEIGQYPLLNPEEEKILGRSIQAGLKAQEKMAEANGNLTPNQKEGIQSQISQGKQDREVFIKSNLRLVVNIAKNFSSDGLAPLDLIQAGNLGLMTAVDKFDPERGFKFSTYAFWWIRQAINREIEDKSRTVRIPAHLQEKNRKVKKVIEESCKESSQLPSWEKIAEQTGFSKASVEAATRAGEEIISLDQPYGAEDGSSLIDLFESKEPDPQEEAVRQDKIEKVRVALATLKPREREVLELRFRNEPLTLEQIAKRFGVTRERIRQIEGKALSRLAKNPDLAELFK